MAKVISLSERDVIKLRLDANHKIRGGNNKKFLEEEYRYLNDRQNILEKQIRDVKLLSDNNIKKPFYGIKNSESDKIKELLLADENSVSYSALNFLPKPPTDKKTGLRLLKEREDELKYINNLTNQELHKHYQDQINNLKLELKYIKKIIKVIKESSDNISYGVLPTPNILPNVSKGRRKDISLSDLYKRQNDLDDLLIILKAVAPDIYERLLKANKNVADYISENSQEIITYIDGAKLTILEDRAFCALRYLAVEAFEKGSVISPSVKITCKQSDIYKLSGLSYNNGYDTKQRRAIKDVITKPDGNLRKSIYIEYKQKHKDGNAILSTNFIKYVSWNDEKEQVIFEIDSVFFVNVPNEPLKSHWNDDIEGRNRYMTEGFNNGFQNENAYRLHRHLASSLRGEELEFNVITLLEQSGLITYLNRGNKTLVLSKLQEYLDIMYEQKTLLKNKPIRISSKSDKYGKYKLTRITCSEEKKNGKSHKRQFGKNNWPNKSNKGK